MVLREVTILSILIRITAAFFLGGILGMERGMKQRPAGLRTYMLVCMGACVIMLTNQYIFQVFRSGDPVRMGAQVVSGIGFLGAGTIVVTRRNQIRGLTTAAGLWASAAVGLALGIGFYEAAFVGGILIFVILTGLHSWDNSLHRRSKTVEVYIELDNSIGIGAFTRAVREKEIELTDVQLDRDGLSDSSVRSFTAMLKLKDRKTRGELFLLLREIPGVVYADEL